MTKIIFISEKYPQWDDLFNLGIYVSFHTHNFSYDSILYSWNSFVEMVLLE